MKAITFDRYGSPDVLRVEEVEEPVPRDDEVLVKVRAASVNPYDWHFMTGLPYVMRLMLGGAFRPKFRRLGGDLAGRVKAVGKSVTRFRPGDEVFGSVNGAVPDHPLLDLGSFAECVTAPESHLALKPSNVTFEAAAGVTLAALTALNSLRDLGHAGPGRKILINGASGGVGTFAVQIGEWLGSEVTGVCSTRNVEFVGSLGADRVVDYTREDFTRGAPRYDLFLDLVGNHALRRCLRVMSPGGIYLQCFGRPENRWLGPFHQIMGARLVSPFVDTKILDVEWHLRTEDLNLLADLLSSGFLSPVLDRCYPLEEAPEAMRYLELGHARGKVVVTV